MSDRPATLGILPARGGSKGITGKNLRELEGHPLLAYARDCARASGVVDRLVLSTDSERIAELGRALGIEVPFLRPPDLAADDTPMLPVLQHCVRELETSGFHPARILLLQPTAPLRRPEHLRDACALMDKTACDSVVGVVEVPAHFNPFYVMKIADERLDNFLPEGARITRRQDVPPAYSRCGTVYLTRRDVLMEQGSIYGKDCRPLIVDEADALNLDTEEDWVLAEVRLKARAAAQAQARKG